VGTAIETVALDLHKRSMIEHIMVYGTTEQVRWMLLFYNEEEISAVVKRSKSLDEKSANFGDLYYDIEKSEALCLNRQSMNGSF
jgi:hypothetical protein